MKELSIEQKAKAYDEAIKKAESLYKAAEPMSGCNVIIETLFPELAESEDEKIRKELIFYLRYQHSISENFEDIGKWIAWLEKQAEHANFRNKIEVGDKVTRNRDGVLVNLSQLNRVAKVEEKQWQKTQGKSALEAIKEEKVDNQNCADKVKPKFKVGDKIYLKPEHRMPDDDTPIADTIHEIIAIDDMHYRFDWSFIFIEDQNKFELVEQKPTDEEMKELLQTKYEKGRADAIAEMQKSAWSEEDEDVLEDVEEAIINYWHGQSQEDLLDLLKSLKDRVQPKQEWSEEDEEHIKSLLERLEGMCKKDATFIRTKFAVSEDEDWLKSLSPQSRWKPSEEQMVAINTAINVIGKGTLNGKQLIELQEQLKKLKGE